MAIQVIPDIRKMARVTQDVDGILIERGFHVTGLTPGASILVDALVAVDAADPNKRIPTYGEPHPDPRMANLYVARIEPMPFLDSNDQAFVKVSYRPPDLSNVNSPIVRFVGTTRETNVNFDVDGKLIKVAYLPKAGKTIPADKMKMSNTKGGRVSAPKAFGVLTVDRIVYEDPSPRLAYMNAINSTPFRGYPKWSWWVRNIVIAKEVYRSGYREHWEIELDGDLYTKVAVFRMLDGEIPMDVHDGAPVDRSVAGPLNGATVVRVNSQKDFNQIGLPLGFG
jgi:hypothetical protein